MTAVKLREWRGVKPVPGPSGAAITTRLRTTPEDDAVLDTVAEHLGRLRRADLAHVCRPVPPGPSLDDEARRQARRDVTNARKQTITAESSSRWAGTIIRANDDQYRLARQSQARHIISLGAAISSIEKRLVQPSGDMLAREDRKTRRGQTRTKGYATQAERFQKQRRLQSLRAELGRVMADRDDKLARVVDGGKRLAKTRHNLSTAGLAEAEWRERWSCARWRIEANGSGDEPFGNLTMTVTSVGEVSLRLPKPLEHLANAKRGRYVLSGRAKFAYRAAEWQARITSGKSVSYALTRKPGRSGVYLTAAWATPVETSCVTAGTADGEVLAAGPVVAMDLNDGHLAIRRLDGHGNPIGSPWRIDFGLTGTTARRDAQVRHAITRLIRYSLRYGTGTIAVEDLNFADARQTGRETMGRGQRGKRFRRTVAGIPTAVFRNRLTGQASRHGIRLLAVNPAYTSAWGDQHWRKPYENVTRHEAAATVIGRRAQGHKARRREGVTRTRPEDRVVRATNQAGPDQSRATSSRHRPRMRGTEISPARPDWYAAIGPGNRYPGTGQQGHLHS
jgi:IS605 OrfB family transposase